MPRPRIHTDDAARKRAYRERKRTGETPLGTVIDGDTPRDVLHGIANDSRAPASSRVQAARALQEADRVSGGGSVKEREWLAVRGALELLPVADRLTFLREQMGRVTRSPSPRGG